MEVRNDHAETQVSNFDKLIDGVVAYLKGEELAVTTGVAAPHIAENWSQLFKGNVMPMLKMHQEQTNEFFGAQLAFSFLKNLTQEHHARPGKLALSQRENKVYVWAEIANHDDAMMEAILQAVIDANFEHRDSGLTISPMIVEEWEQFPVPPQYKLISMNA